MITSKRAVVITAAITPVTGGTASGILWSNAGVLAAGPATTDGSGNLASIGSISGLTGQGLIIVAPASNNMYFGAGGNGTVSTATIAILANGTTAELKSTGILQWSSDTTPFGTADTILKRAAAATFQFGAAAVDTAPVAQTLSVQNALAGGTSNVAGANFTLAGSQGKGTGVGGDVAAQIALAGTTGTTVNALSDGWRLKGTGSFVLNSAAVATNATDGFIYIATSAGQPTGTPTSFTGRVPLVFDTTNSQFWIFTGGAWKQPKTPAAAAIITWQ